MLEIMFNVCRLLAYSNTRRGCPRIPIKNIGKNVQLKKMKNVQKCHLLSLRFMVLPVIFGNQK